MAPEPKIGRCVEVKTKKDRKSTEPLCVDIYYNQTLL